MKEPELLLQGTITWGNSSKGNQEFRGGACELAANIDEIIIRNHKQKPPQAGDFVAFKGVSVEENPQRFSNNTTFDGEEWDFAMPYNWTPTRKTES